MPTISPRINFKLSFCYFSRWRGSKSGLSAVRVFGDGVLSAGHGITLWDLDTKTVTKNFTGHPSLITQLEVIPDTDYFVTMCHTERHLRIWYAFIYLGLI